LISFELSVESIVLAILSATSFYYYVELALTSEPAESCVELCAAKTSFLLEFGLSHLTICVEYVPYNACVVTDVVDFHNN